MNEIIDIAKKGVRHSPGSHQDLSRRKQPCDDRDESPCNMITDMERKTEMLDHVTGEEDSENLAKSVLIGILDQTSREHNETYHEGTRSCEQ